LVVAFAAREGFDACQGDMDGRWFDFRRLRVERYAPPAECPDTPPRGAAALGGPSLDDFFSSLGGT